MFVNKMKDIYTYILQSKKEGKKLFADKDWEKVVPDFRLNNDSASEALIEFGKGLF